MKEVKLKDGLWVRQVETLQIGIKASLGTSEIRYASTCRRPCASHDQNLLGFALLYQVRDIFEIWTVRTFERPTGIVGFGVEPHLEVEQTAWKTDRVATADERCRAQEIQQLGANLEKQKRWGGAVEAVRLFELRSSICSERYDI
jgi:hypothetical protein